MTTTLQEIPLPTLPVPQLPVTAWRRSKGEEHFGNTKRDRRRVRLAWSATEAADLAGVPRRTVYDWAGKQLVEPTVMVEPAPHSRTPPMSQPGYGAGDVLALRFLADIAAHLPRSLVDAAGAEANTLFEYDDREPWSFAGIAREFPVWVLPGNEEGAAVMHEEIGGPLIPCSGAVDPLEEIEADGVPILGSYVLYRARLRCEQLEERATAWWRKVGTPPKERPPWM